MRQLISLPLLFYSLLFVSPWVEAQNTSAERAKLIKYFR